MMLDLGRDELESFESGDEIVEKYKKRITKLNDNPKFQAMMDYEERLRLEANTSKKLAYEEGANSGKKEEQLEIAKKLLKMNFTFEQISEATGLSFQELALYKESNSDD